MATGGQWMLLSCMEPLAEAQYVLPAIIRTDWFHLSRVLARS